MTDPTAIPINIFENERELMVVTPMPGVAAEDISIEVHDDGRLSLRADQHGPGQERIDYLLREWSYGPFERVVTLPRPVDGGSANLAFGNGVLTITFSKADRTAPASLALASTGHARGSAAGHTGSRKTAVG
jgi:HSP20 family protein